MVRTLKTSVCLGLISLGIAFGLNGYEPQLSEASGLTVAVDRWLEVRHLTGTVFLETSRGRVSAQSGAKLQAVGDTLQTMDSSTARLAIDTGAGFVSLSENTTLRIRSLERVASGGRRTRLQILSGQARLTVPPFTNPDSELEIETPAGWSGVRGTEFGVAVRPDGTTSVATLEGSVETGAQQQSVMIDDGFQSLVINGEPPLPPFPITENTQLDIQQIEKIGNRVHLKGRVDPVNLLLIENIAQRLDPSGNFAITVPVPGRSRMTAVVITPLGKRQKYELGLY